MLLTILKIVAGLAVLGVVAMIMVAVVSGLTSAMAVLRRRKKGGDTRPMSER